MALFEIYLDVDEEYKDTIKTIYTFFVIMIVFHILMSLSYNGSKPILFGLTRELFNDDFMNLLFIGMISIIFYYFISVKLLKFV
jgi:hypothetical protein